MNTKVDWVQLIIVVTAGGFLAARWRRAESMHSLEEWGLGGRGFGTVVTWFLLGGDLYTAYTFVALLWVSSYAKDSPRLLGFPFFYWYQFLWVLISAALTWMAYLLVRRAERRR